MSIQQLVFYAFGALLVLSGLMMIVSRNTVKSALFLVLAFFASSALWILLEAEFLALILIFVYVGAVMTLFLFVIMMIQLKPEQLKGGFVRYLPIALIVSALMVGIMVYVIEPSSLASGMPKVYGPEYSNIKALGSVLYTEYVYPFELAAILLLIAIISAISLAHKGQPKSRVQDVNAQLAATKADRLRVVSMPTEKRVGEE